MASQIKFSASSPDDEALVCAAKFFGFRFEGRREGAAQVRTNYGVENFKYVIHHQNLQQHRQRGIGKGIGLRADAKGVGLESSLCYQERRSDREEEPMVSRGPESM